MLQIIQEEQNEMSITLSSCSSQSSSPCITPRTSIRPMLTLNKPNFDYPLILNSNESDIHKTNLLNQYLPGLNRLQNNQ